MARRPSKHLRPARPLSSGHATTASKRDGEWVVRSVPGAATEKTYRCPGCQQLIGPGTPHLVAWPERAERLVGVVGRRGAAALAHGVLAAAAVTESSRRGLFHTQLGTSGPRVVFLHGVFGQGRNWTTIAKALSGQARVSLVDLPNHGRSPWTDHFSYPEMANQVADLLQTEAGGEPYAVVGHSMGGKVAMAVALLHPELVQRLCVVDVSPVPRRVSGFETYVRGTALDRSRHPPDRASADAQLQPYVPEPAIRGFLLQNLRRDHPPAAGWRWQMNLAADR